MHGNWGRGSPPANNCWTHLQTGLAAWVTGKHLGVTFRKVKPHTMQATGPKSEKVHVASSVVGTSVKLWPAKAKC